MRRSRRSTDTRLSAAGRRWADERGSASLEFITVGLLLLLPVVYLVLTLAALQGASLAVEGATRQAARVFVQSGSLADAQAAAQTAIEVTLADGRRVEASICAVDHARDLALIKLAVRGLPVAELGDYGPLVAAPSFNFPNGQVNLTDGNELIKCLDGRLRQGEIPAAIRLHRLFERNTGHDLIS